MKGADMTHGTTLAEAMRRVKTLARSGLSPQDIADRTGLMLGGINTVLGIRRPRGPSRPLMSDEAWERAYAPHEYRHKQLDSKLDRIIQLLSEGRE